MIRNEIAELHWEDLQGVVLKGMKQSREKKQERVRTCLGRPAAKHKEQSINHLSLSLYPSAL